MVAVAGYYLFTQSQKNAAPNQSTSQAAPKISTGKVTGPASLYKIPESLEKAKRANQDTVAWLQVPNTDINNSVVQAIDNNYYLRRNEQKEDDAYGCYYADFECSVGAREVLDPNTIIYGHSNLGGDDPNGKRFSQLFKFTDPEMAKKTPYIYLATSEERLTFEVFAVFYTKTDFDYIKVQISNEEMREITKKAEELSIYDYGKEITAEDKILTLSTCTEKFGTDGTYRYVVMARLIPEKAEELPEVDFVIKS